MKIDIKNINVFFLIFCAALLGMLPGCASVQADRDLNTKPENAARGDPTNTVRVKEYLQNVLSAPENFKIKAYHRKAYSPDTKKTFFVFHCFYVIFKNEKMEHTLVFTATPKGSLQNGTWMFDAVSDIESYNSFIESPHNPWDVVEYQGRHGETNLDVIKTTQKILTRLDKGYRFFGGSVVRDMAWYHQIWLFLVPPPILTYAPLLIMSIKADSCASAVLETMVWE